MVRALAAWHAGRELHWLRVASLEPFQAAVAGPLDASPPSAAAASPALTASTAFLAASPRCSASASPPL
eukprot:5030394-Prymnesium_polylepis.1